MAGTLLLFPRRALMDRSPYKLRQAARSCREMAGECATEEAREAMLEVADTLDGEASAKANLSGRIARDAPMFNWTR